MSDSVHSQLVEQVHPMASYKMVAYRVMFPAAPLLPCSIQENWNSFGEWNQMYR